VALLVGLGIGGFLYLQPQELTCDEWLAEVREWEREGGAQLLGEYLPGSDRPEFTEEEQKAIFARLRELFELEPEGCRP
jgi:hypothetical protein